MQHSMSKFILKNMNQDEQKEPVFLWLLKSEGCHKSTKRNDKQCKETNCQRRQNHNASTENTRHIYHFCISWGEMPMLQNETHHNAHSNIFISGCFFHNSHTGSYWVRSQLLNLHRQHKAAIKQLKGLQHSTPLTIKSSYCTNSSAA